MVSNDHLTPSVNPKDSDPVPSPCDTNVTTSSMIPRASSISSLRDLIQPLSRSSAPPSPLPSSPFSAPQTDKKQQIVCKRSQAGKDIYHVIDLDTSLKFTFIFLCANAFAIVPHS